MNKQKQKPSLRRGTKLLTVGLAALMGVSLAPVAPTLGGSVPSADLPSLSLKQSSPHVELNLSPGDRVGSIRGVKIGRLNSNVYINRDASGNTNNGELQIGRGEAISPTGQVIPLDFVPGEQQVDTRWENTRNIGNETMFLMYIGSNPNRFEVSTYKNDKFVVAKYWMGKWYYDDNYRLIPFTPNSNDFIVGFIKRDSTASVKIDSYTDLSVNSHEVTRDDVSIYNGTGPVVEDLNAKDRDGPSSVDNIVARQESNGVRFSYSAATDSGSSFAYKGTTNYIADRFTQKTLTSVHGFPVAGRVSNFALNINRAYDGSLYGGIEVDTFGTSVDYFYILSPDESKSYKYYPEGTWYNDEFTTNMHENGRADACYVMFAPDSDLHTRMPMYQASNENRNFRSVCFDASDGWLYDNNSGSYKSFTRKSNDLIVAEIWRNKSTSRGIDGLEVLTRDDVDVTHAPLSVGSDPRSWTSTVNVNVPASGVANYHTSLTGGIGNTASADNLSGTSWFVPYSNYGGLHPSQSFRIYASDHAGNRGSVRSFTLDAPQLQVSTNSSGWTNENVPISVDAYSGTYSINQITKNGAPLWTSSGERVDFVSSNGTYVYEATDTNGFTWGDSVTISNIDKSKPTGTLKASTTSPTKGDVTLNLTGVSDVGGSGLKNIMLPNGTVVTGTSASQVVSANGTYTFKIYDNAGNIGTETITVSNIDKTAPTGTLTQSPTGWTNGNVNLTLSSIADSGSGVKNIKLPNGTLTTGTSASYVVYDKGTYSFVITDNAGNTTTKTITVSNIDKTPPTANLSSAVSGAGDSVILTLNSIADAGGSGYYRTRLPDYTYSTATSMTYTVTENGTYSFYVYDKAGNVTTKTISVTNVDQTPPTATLTQTPTAWTNGNVTLNLANVADSGSGVKNIKLPNGNFVTGTSASYTVSANNTYTFLLTDNSGNTAEKTIKVSNIDKVAPTGNLSASTTAWTKGNVTLNLTSIADSGGSGVKNIKLPNGTLVTGTTASQVVTANGTYSFVITDNAGNVTTKSIAVTNMDKAVPTGTLTKTPTGWTNGNVTLNLTSVVDSGGSGLKNIKLPNGTFVTGSSASQVVTANGSYSFVIYDNAGNTTTKTISVTNIDKAAPAASLSQTPTGWTNGNVTLNLTSVTDTGGSGLKNIKLPNGTFVTGSSASQVVTADGTYSFVITDNAGNSTTKTITVSNIDKSAPTANIGASTTSWTKGNVTLTLSAIADTGGAGLKSVTLPNGNVITSVTATSYTHVVTANGSYSFVVEDKAGNKTTKTISVTNIDKSTPVGTVSASTTAWTNGNVTLTLSGIADSGVSGLKSVTLPNGSVISPVAATSYAQTVTVNGTYTFKVLDNAGNQLTRSITVTNIDKSSPTGTLTASTTSWTNQNVTLTLSGIQDVGGAGVKNVKLPNGTFSTASTVTYSVSGNGSYSFVITDNAGNTTTRSITVSNIDKTVPTLSLSYNNTTNVITATVADSGGSGLKEITRPDGTKVTGSSTTYTPPTFGDYTFTVSDTAGNVTTKSIFADKIIVIPDDALRQAILQKMNQQFGGTHTASHIREKRMSELTGTLSVPSKGIVNLTGSEYLKGISSMNLSGNPISNLAPLANLTQLTALDLKGTNVTSISSLQKLTNLEDLSLEDTDVADLTAVASMKKLQSLNIRSTQVSNITPVGSLKSITELWASNAKLTSIAGLQNATNLQYLGVESNSLTNLNGVSGMTQLREIYAGRNQLTSISAVGNLTNLTVVDLHRNQLTSAADLAKSTNMTYLDVSVNKLTNITMVNGMSKLSFLSIDGNKVESIEPLRTNTVLKSLYASDNHLWDMSPLANNSALTALDLSNNLIGKVPTNLNTFSDDVFYNNFIAGKPGQNQMSAIASTMMEEDETKAMSVHYTTVSTSWTSKATPKVTVSGNSGLSGENVKWNSFTMRTSSPSNGIGTVTFELNPDVKRTFQVTVLAVMPELIVTPSNETGWTNGTITLDVQASTRVTDIQRIFLPNGTSVLGTSTQYVVSKNGIYGFAVLDGYGRFSYTFYEVRNIDKKSPSVSLVVPGDWTNKDPIIELDVIND